jgi:hypothetical protein
MNQHDRELEKDLRSSLRHRLRPMSGRDPRERDRTTTPVELLYDLTYVVAFSAAAEQLAHHLVEGHPARAIGAYAFAVFAISWAWLNFTWFGSAYGNDDAMFRVATIVQMGGVVVLGWCFLFGNHCRQVDLVITTRALRVLGGTNWPTGCAQSRRPCLALILSAA